MAIQGLGLHDKNVRLRFLIYIFFGIAALGSVLYWRTQALTNAEYVEFGTLQTSEKRNNDGTLRSNRYQIETFETNPSIN
ncbi:MAG TPA: hypothetical protein PKD79_02225 [Candidatus Doudnabacteria bacterium]|nr:hypothetical protein [Candidatus Doudnabacteria bacterium]